MTVTIKNFRGEFHTARWEKNEIWKKNELIINIVNSSNIITVLGTIRKTNDGRFTWWINSVKSFYRFPNQQHKQGTCLTEEEAKEKVEEYWNDLIKKNADQEEDIQ